MRILLIVAAMALVPHANAEGKAARCYLKVNKTVEMNGPCKFIEHADPDADLAKGSFEVIVNDHNFAYVNISQKFLDEQGMQQAEVFWSNDSSHAQTGLGANFVRESRDLGAPNLHNDPACLVNSLAEICAW